ncbi:MAG: GMC family oxidoreductase, partial [Betaproteobacteria bacterium]
MLLLEAGDFKSDAVLNEHYRGTASAPHPDPTQYRRMGFGGTTRIWGGRCVPFEPIDFERREYVANSGWPIRYDEVARYYPRALGYCDAGKFDFSASGSLSGAPATIPGFDGDGIVLHDCIERYSLPTNFGTRYRKKLERSANVTTLLNARCVKLNKSGGDDRIETVEIVDRNGTRRLIRAERFVLATGGIETARLLLASDEDGIGLGNRGDKVGRYYACHFENTFGKLVPRETVVSFDFEKTDDGVYSRRKLMFAPEAQRRHRLLNTAFRLHFPAYSDPSHGSAVLSTIFLAKSMLIPEYRAIMQHGTTTSTATPLASHLYNVSTGIPHLLRFSYDYFFRTKLATRKLPYTLVANADGSYPLEFN